MTEPDPASRRGVAARSCQALPGFVSRAADLVAEVPFMRLGGFTGPAARAVGGVRFAWAEGLLVSAMAHLCFARSVRRARLFDGWAV